MTLVCLSIRWPLLLESGAHWNIFQFLNFKLEVFNTTHTIFFFYKLRQVDTFVPSFYAGIYFKKCQPKLFHTIFEFMQNLLFLLQDVFDVYTWYSEFYIGPFICRSSDPHRSRKLFHSPIYYIFFLLYFVVAIFFPSEKKNSLRTK